MISVDNEVYTECIKALDFIPGIEIGSESTKTPANFPYVSIVQADNYIDTSTQSSKNTENCVVVMFEINVYSNKKNGKKTECNDIAKVVDDVFLRLGFTRTAFQSVPNWENASIYRITARYRAKVSKEKYVFRR